MARIEKQMCKAVIHFCQTIQIEYKRPHKQYYRAPVNKELLTGTVPVNSELLTGMVPVNKELLTGTVLVNNLLQKINTKKKHAHAGVA